MGFSEEVEDLRCKSMNRYISLGKYLFFVEIYNYWEWIELL